MAFIPHHLHKKHISLTITMPFAPFDALILFKPQYFCRQIKKQ